MARRKIESSRVVVTGASSGIGFELSKQLLERGANVIVTARRQEKLDKLRDYSPKPDQLEIICGDITDSVLREQLVQTAKSKFGGLDILVSNAGAATEGAMTDLDDETLRAAFELNFFAHQRFAVAAADLFRQQGHGGHILFNVSKQAVNPGKNFGAYGLPKATTFLLLRQLALELGRDGIQVNGVNADRIRSGLLTEDFIESRAKARGTDPATYMSGNLLGREVLASDVAQAFVALTKSRATTGHVMTVDGGNIEAALR